MNPNTSFRIIETDPASDSRWENFVYSHPSGTIYHHPAWIQALESEYGSKGLHLACVDADGDFLAIMPTLYTRGLPFNLGGRLGGPRLSSLPRTPEAGVLSKDVRATVAIVETAIRRVQQTPGLQLQLKNEKLDLGSLEGEIFPSQWRFSYLLNLQAQPDQPLRIGKNHHRRASIKAAVKKAERLGVEVRPAESETELRAWYRLYLTTMRRNAVPPRPFRFFLSLWRLLRGKSLLQLLIAERQSTGQRKMLAGALFLRFGSTVTYAFSAMSNEDRSLGANDAILWQAIHEASKAGFRRFDFGEVPEGHSELAAFKTKWGAEPHRLWRYQYPAPSTSTNGDLEPYFGMRCLAEALWRHLPLRMAEYLGDRIYSYL